MITDVNRLYEGCKIFIHDETEADAVVRRRKVHTFAQKAMKVKQFDDVRIGCDVGVDGMRIHSSYDTASSQNFEGGKTIEILLMWQPRKNCGGSFAGRHFQFFREFTCDSPETTSIVIPKDPLGLFVPRMRATCLEGKLTPSRFPEAPVVRTAGPGDVEKISGVPEI